MEIVKIALAVLQCIVSIVLIVIVMSQNSKNDGLTGATSTPVAQSFKGKPGIDEQLRTYTIYTSVVWFVLCVALGIVNARF